MRQIMGEQQITSPPLEDRLSLHETGLDSPAPPELNDDLEIEPLAIADTTFPSTVGDCVADYENVPA
jgi:hypothetical protein